MTSFLEAFSLEADMLFEKAKRYRAEANELSINDTRKAVYERVIVDLLEHSRSISNQIITHADKG